MRYVDDLKRSAAKPAMRWGTSSRRGRYLRKNARKLSVAACESDPVAAVSALGDFYESERQRHDELAEMLMLACHQLALGQDPAPLPSAPQADAAGSP